MITDEIAEACIAARVPWCVDAKEWHRAVTETHDLCEVLIQPISIVLNQIHGCNHSQRFWHILVGPWLGQFIGLVCDRAALLSHAPDQEWQSKIQPSNRVVPRTVYESIKLIETPEFSDQLLTDIHNCMTAGSLSLDNAYIERNRKHLTFATQIDFVGPNPWMRNLYNFYKRMVTPKGAVVVSNSSIPLRFHKHLYYLQSCIRGIVPVQDPASYYDLEPDVKLRQTIESELKGNDRGLQALASSLIHAYLPTCFLESFERMKRASKKYPSQPAAILMGTEIYGRYESFCYWIAAEVEAGARLASMQHGGTYGNEAASEFVFPEIAPVDRFYSWGWRWPKYKMNVTKVHPMPAMFLHGQAKLPTGAGDDILFVSTALHPTVRRLCGSEGRPYYQNTYVAEQMNFYKYLPENVKNRLLVRLYPGAFGERYRSQWEQQSPPARIDDGTNSFDKVLDQCSIFTTDHLSTTWLQAMSKNIPTVIFIDFDQYDFAPEALAWMATLQDVGILHRSSKSAADHIVMIQNEPRKWWDAKQTQETLAAFLNVFAMDSEDAIEVWAAELVGLRAAAATRKPPSEQGLSV